MDKKKIILIALIITLTLSIIGVAYAYFGLEVEGTGKDIVMDTGDLRLEYMDDTELSLVGATPGDSISKTITVKNVGTRNVAYTLYWGDLINTIENFELHITMECKSYKNYGTDTQEESGTCDRIYRAVPMSDTITSGTIKNNISIDVGVTHVYNLTVTFDDKSYEQNYNKNKKFTGKIGIEEFKAPEPIYCTYDGDITKGTEFTKGIYTYRYKQRYVIDVGWEDLKDDGWNASISDTYHNNQSPITEPPCTYINNIPVTSYENLFSSSYATTIDVSNFNTSNVTDMMGMFSYSKATSILGLDKLDTSNVTDMSNMFGKVNVSSLDLSNFNTSNVTNMSWMFEGCENITSLNLSSFDTSKVTDMESMFSSATVVTLDLSSFDTSNVTTMESMFYRCTVKSLDLSNFDTNNVANMSYMFNESQATLLKINNFNTSNVTTMNGMFSDSKVESLDLSSFNTSKVTNMSSMFSNCVASEIKGFEKLNTSNVTDMSYMFNSTAITDFNFSNSFDTSNVTNMNYMFFSSKATIIDVSGFDTSNVTSMRYMFGYNDNLKTIYVSNKFTVDKVTSSSGMFSKDTNLIGGAETKFDSTKTDKTYARIDTADTPGYFTLKS